MYSMRCASTSCVDTKAIRISVLLVSATVVRNVTRLFAVALAGALLAACAQSSVVTRNSEFTASRQASLQHNRTASFVTNRRVASVKKHTPFASHKNAGKTQIASQGVASFYTEGTETASGEKFDTHDLTAAHPTLPFGTKLRVTNVATGRSVTVRVNDRGPYVPGRNVDVSYSAADALGWLERDSQRSGWTSCSSSSPGYARFRARYFGFGASRAISGRRFSRRLPPASATPQPSL